jgi:hypothetical protein
MKKSWLSPSTPKQARSQVLGRTGRNYTALKILNKLLLKSYQPVNFEDLSGLGKLIEFLQVVKLGKRLYPLAGQAGHIALTRMTPLGMRRATLWPHKSMPSRDLSASR